MMPPDNNTCRNCGSSEHYWEEVNANGGYGPRLLPIGAFKNPKFQIRVCGGCGLVDWFVSPKYLDSVKTNFRRRRKDL